MLNLASLSLWILLLFIVPLLSRSPTVSAWSSRTFDQQAAPPTRQLHAARGEITKIRSSSGRMLLITVRPAKEFAEVTVAASENDLVGHAVGRAGAVDILGLLAGDERDEETITAAELNEGDVVSVIYDPQVQNRVLEIYVR